VVCLLGFRGAGGLAFLRGAVEAFCHAVLPGMAWLDQDVFCPEYHQGVLEVMGDSVGEGISVMTLCFGASWVAMAAAAPVGNPAQSAPSRLAGTRRKRETGVVIIRHEQRLNLTLVWPLAGLRRIASNPPAIRRRLGSCRLFLTPVWIMTAGASRSYGRFVAPEARIVSQ
jgi:hypothetical protein